MKLRQSVYTVSIPYRVQYNDDTKDADTDENHNEANSKFQFLIGFSTTWPWVIGGRLAVSSVMFQFLIGFSTTLMAED